MLGCLNAEQDGYRSSDIDLFICGITDEHQANQKVMLLSAKLNVEVEKHLQHSFKQHQRKG